MNVSTPIPSRLLRSTAVVARWLLGLLSAAWLVLALLLVVLHAWIVPRIDEWRGALEQQATRLVGAPVRIGAITARSSSLFPTLELRDVRLLDSEQRDALYLERVIASVSPRSLWNLGFEQLYIEKAALDMRLSQEGRLYVAGLDVSRLDADAAGQEDHALADWFFAQREFVIAKGSVRWTDETRGSPPLLLSDVQFVARNAGRRHQLRLDATPPAGWGERFSVRGQFRAPLLSVHRGRWQKWDGQIQAELPHIDVSQLGRYVSLDARIREGHGAVRAWVDVQDGQPVGGSLDLALPRINTVLGRDLRPLVLHDLTGRLSLYRNPQFMELSTENLQFTTGDGLRWPGGNLWFRHEPAQAKAPENGALRADHLDLSALALIADRLPLAQRVRQLITTRAPQGQVEHIELGWRGPADAPTAYHAKGRVTHLAVAGDAPVLPTSADERPPVGTPGVRGLSADFELNQDGGHAQLTLTQGALEFPGVFADPVLPMDQASMRAQWTVRGSHIELKIPELRFANADAEGIARATWRTADPAQSGSGSRFPGVLDLQGKLTRADGTRVWRYLPLDIPADTRDYVRDAVRRGTASSTEFLVRGDLWDMPFDDPQRGDFRIAAKVRDVEFAYIPRLSAAAAARAAADDIATLPWPALQALSGELVFERSGMQVHNARGHLAGARQLEVFQGEAQIADMSMEDPVLSVDAQMRGPLTDLTRLGTPLLRDLPDALSFASGVQAEGSAHYRFQMQLPLAQAEQVKVQAQVNLSNNTLRMAPDTPPLTQVQGRLQFTESGFSLNDLQAQLMGGATRWQGQGRWDGEQPDIALNVQGRLHVDGLRDVQEWPWLHGPAQHMEGSTPFNAQIGWRDGRPNFQVQSDLKGLALRWPAPFAKAAADALPLRVSQQLHADATGAAAQEHFELRLGNLASADYRSVIRDGTPQLQQGALRLGPQAVEADSMPDDGVLAVVALPRMDVDAWRSLVSSAVPSDQAAARTQAALVGEGVGFHPWMPSHFGLQTGALVVAGRTLHDVVLGGSRDGSLWRANVHARELSGYAEYNARQAGRLHARLARLKIEASAAQDVESLLDEQPDTLPALDVVVEDLELLGRSLGRLEVQALNQRGAAREWQLNRLSLSTPEARFLAHGRWSAAANRSASPRRTALDFELNILNAGALLERFGMPDVLRSGRGTLAGQVQWRGSPFAIDYPSLDGQMKLDVSAGQFLKAEPGIAKLLGVLSLQALPRRFTLDFRDIFSAGFAFDFIRGDARIEGGVASSNNLQMKGVNAAVLMEGWADIARETQKLHVVVVPEINAGTAALVATAINPAIGLGAFLAQAVLSGPLVAATTREFEIDGTWADPRVTQVPRRNTAAPPPVQVSPSASLSRWLPELPALSLPHPSLPDWLRSDNTAPTQEHP